MSLNSGKNNSTYLCATSAVFFSFCLFVSSVKLNCMMLQMTNIGLFTVKKGLGHKLGDFRSIKGTLSNSVDLDPAPQARRRNRIFTVCLKYWNSKKK